MDVSPKPLTIHRPKILPKILPSYTGLILLNHLELFNHWESFAGPTDMLTDYNYL